MNAGAAAARASTYPSSEDRTRNSTLAPYADVARVRFGAAYFAAKGRIGRVSETEVVLLAWCPREGASRAAWDVLAAAVGLLPKREEATRAIR